MRLNFADANNCSSVILIEKIATGSQHVVRCRLRSFDSKDYEKTANNLVTNRTLNEICRLHQMLSSSFRSCQNLHLADNASVTFSSCIPPG